MKLGSLRFDNPVVQAGLGGGLARHELAAAVSSAGGLGTIGMLDAAGLHSELAAARARTSKPIAVNLLLPFVRPGHWKVAQQADVVFTFWGRPVRKTSRVWIHQCGSIEEALAAREAGADAVVMQGIEAGGHVRGELPALELLTLARHSLPPDFPVLVAGGIATAADVRTALDRGAEGAALGTRFLMTEESAAHPKYKQRLVEADRTFLTNLFGFGWPARHRVVPNAATERWGETPPAWMKALLQVSSPLSRVVSIGGGAAIASLQRPWFPLLSPKSATREDPATLVDAGPLYAGETVLRICEIVPAANVVRDLTS